MTNQNIADSIIKIFFEVGIDGETMEYIIDKMGMRDQMIKQLVTNKVKYNLEQTSISECECIPGCDCKKYTFTEQQLIEFTKELSSRALDAAKEAITSSGVDMESYVELDLNDREISIEVDCTGICNEIISNVEDAFSEIEDNDSIIYEIKKVLDHIREV
jgi:hypothetical protein